MKGKERRERQERSKGERFQSLFKISDIPNPIFLYFPSQKTERCPYTIPSHTIPSIINQYINQ